VKPNNLVLVLACVVLLWSAAASAQTKEPPSSVSAIIKTVARDPATYAPVALKYAAMRLDWESSQIFFHHGFVEHNARYTVSGLEDDVAVSHATGHRRLAVDSLRLFARTVPQNVAERATEALFIRRFPQHRKLFLVAGQAARIAGASYLAYSWSRPNLGQWRRNERLAAQMGLK
jgi:hypothetical protein